jgi:hypothetical protein
MREFHHPTIRRHGERWVLDCPECQQDARARQCGHEELPIGIGMPLESRLTAEMLQENHAGHGPAPGRLVRSPRLGFTGQ